MPVVICVSCNRNVLPKTDFTCPNCGQDTAGSSALPPMTAQEIEDLRAWDDFQQEEAGRSQELRQRNAGTNTMLLAGAGLCALGVGVTAFSYMTVGPGGSHVAWTGAIVVGLSLFVRGLMRKGHTTS